MRRHEIYKSKFWKAADLAGGPITLEIERAAYEELRTPDGGSQQKVVLYFKGEQRALPVGITVFDTIVDVTNEPDSDNWGTHRVELFASTVEVHGERKPCVRVRKPKGELALQKPTPATAKRAVRDDMDDEIPF